MRAAGDGSLSFEDLGPARSNGRYTMPREHSDGDAKLLADSASAAFEASRCFVQQVCFGATFLPDGAVEVSGQPLGFDLSPIDDDTIGSFIPDRSAQTWRAHVSKAGWVETAGFSKRVGVGRVLSEHYERLFGLHTVVELGVGRFGATRPIDGDGPHLVAQLAGSSALEVDGQRHAILPGMAASLSAGTQAVLGVDSPWATVIVADGGADTANIQAAMGQWRASVDLRREPIDSFDPIRRALWRPSTPPPDPQGDPVAVRCCAPGGAVLFESTDNALVVAIGGRLVSVSRRWVYPLAVTLAGAPVSLDDLDGLFGGDRQITTRLVNLGRSHGWLEAVGPGTDP